MSSSVETSLWNGFSRLSYQQRTARIAELARLDQASIEALSGRPVTADVGLAESCVENAIGYFAAPLGVAAYLLIDGRDVVVPMAVEENSIIAAAMKRQSFRKFLDGRTRLDVRRYEEILEANGVADLNDSKVCDPDVWRVGGPFVYAGAHNHQRQYVKRSPTI